MPANRTRKLLLSVLSIVLLLACQIANPGGPVTPPTAAPTQQPMLVGTTIANQAPVDTLTPSETAASSETPIPSATPTPAARARRVVILSIDGLRPDVITSAPMENLLKLMQNGAYSLSAQTTYPSVTLVDHASMLTGMCPSKHGVNWND